MDFKAKIKLWAVKSWIFVKNYAAVSCLVALVIMAILLVRDKKVIQSLKADIEILKAKSKIEKLATENNVSVNNIEKLKEKDEQLKKEIKAIEESIVKVAKDSEMTTQEIVDALNKIYGK